MVIGCGNDARGDDAAGLLVARRLRQLGVHAVERPGEATDLIEAFAGVEDVTVVDAVVTGARPGAIHLWKDTPPPLPPAATGSSHGMGIAEAIALAGALGRLPRRLRVYGIEAARLGLGSRVSPEVLAAVEAVAQEIAGVGAG